MVIKGRARGGPVALATHLERRDTNETVSVRELCGVTARDVRGALREMDCMGAGALSTRTLYHAAINTAPDESLTDEQKHRAVERLERELGFEGQPRIVVEHLKKNREHIHVVFLRIDTDRMIAIPDSHNYRKHEIVARDLEREFGHEHVQGAHIDREGQERPKRTPGHDEMQQAERTGMSPQQAKKYVTKLWNQADSGKAFASAMAAEGWVLAKGDSRDFVLVDPAGETHSLARRIDGVKAADIRQRMSDVDHTGLPSVADARAEQRNLEKRRHAQEKEKAEAKRPESAWQPLILKVETPSAEVNPAIPLSIRNGRAVALGQKATPPIDSASVPEYRLINETKPEPEARSKSRSLGSLYIAAYAATQRVYAKARNLFQAKEKPDKGSIRKVESKPSVAVQPIATSTSRKDPTVSREGSRQRPGLVFKGTNIRSKAPPLRTPLDSTEENIGTGQYKRNTTSRLSREELNSVVSNQRQHRDKRGGPSR